MTSPRRGRVLVLVRLALAAAFIAVAVHAGSPVPVSDRVVTRAPVTTTSARPMIRIEYDRAYRVDRAPPPTTTTAAPRRPTSAPVAPRRPTATIARPRPPPPPASATGLPAAAEQWRSIVARYTDWPVTLMLWTVWCESRGNPNALNSIGAAGLFQHYPTPDGPWRDPAYNTDLAHSKWAARGMQPWSESRGCWTGH